MENEAGVTVVPKDICVADTVSEGTDLSTNGKKKKQKRPKKDKFNIIKDIQGTDFNPVKII